MKGLPEVVSTCELPADVAAQAQARYRLRHAPLRRLGPDRFLGEVAEARAVICAPGDEFDAALIGRLPSTVGLLASYSAGLDHIDLEAAAARGVRVTHTPDVLTDATAEIALLLILAVARGTGEAERRLRTGGWTGWSPAQVFGSGIKGKVLGLVGGGRIAVATAVRARAFGVGLSYWSRSASPQLDAVGAARQHRLEVLFAAADIVSLHLPSTSETRGLVGERLLAQARRGLLLINTARGDLLDEDAVLAALADGRLGGVGLDVFRGEPAIDPRWRTAPNAVLLPHIGSATRETRAAMGAKVLADLDAFFACDRSQGAVP